MMCVARVLRVALYPAGRKPDTWSIPVRELDASRFKGVPQGACVRNRDCRLAVYTFGALNDSKRYLRAPRQGFRPKS
jgi:hypothetical protein